MKAFLFICYEGRYMARLHLLGVHIGAAAALSLSPGCEGDDELGPRDGLQVQQCVIQLQLDVIRCT